MYDDTIKGDGRRNRRLHSPEFKASVVAQCLQPHVSMASVARAHDLNANLLRRWVSDHQHGQPPQPMQPCEFVAAQDSRAVLNTTVLASRNTSDAFRLSEAAAVPGFIAVHSRVGSATLAATIDQPVAEAESGVPIDLKAGQWQIRIHWPDKQLAALSNWLRELVT